MQISLTKLFFHAGITCSLLTSLQARAEGGVCKALFEKNSSEQLFLFPTKWELELKAEGTRIPNFRDLYRQKVGLDKFKRWMNGPGPGVYGDPSGMPIERIFLKFSSANSHIEPGQPSEDFMIFEAQMGPNKYTYAIPLAKLHSLKIGESVPIPSISQASFPFSAGERRHLFDSLETLSLAGRLISGDSGYRQLGVRTTLQRTAEGLKIVNTSVDQSTSHGSYTIERTVQLKADLALLWSPREFLLKEEAYEPGHPRLTTVEVVGRPK